jgi:NAD(P)-dependent dehydrogenase (short-subunit alcohol dehydrogenase family)
MATPQEHTRVALVTGAAQGIGRAIALRLANDGLDVAVNDLPGKIDSLGAVVEEIRRLGRRAFAVTSDVSKEDEVKAMVQAAVSALGRLDVVRHKRSSPEWDPSHAHLLDGGQRRSWQHWICHGR